MIADTFHLTAPTKPTTTSKVWTDKALCMSIAAAMHKAFDWGGSSDGHAYWAHVVQRLTDMAK